jgi:hypothetical protein
MSQGKSLVGKIIEVPVSYRGRSYDEGKKIGWRDGVDAVVTLFRMRFQKNNVKSLTQ